MAVLSKLQIRAKVLSVISEIKSFDSYNEAFISKFILELSDIDDKDTLFDIFIKEFIKMSENEYMFASCILKSLFSPDYVQEKVFKIFESSSYSDEAKYKLVQLLRVVGSNSAYDSIPQYFDNPEEVLDMETQKLLEKAVVNPEAMLDFLDFIYAVPSGDKKLLLNSLKTDYQGDVLANIIYPILYADFDDDFKLVVIDVLSESKSSLAIEPFNYLISVSENKDIVNACSFGLKKLKLSGASVEKANLYFRDVIKNTIPADFYTTIPDGSGNQALLISRKSASNKYVFEAVVINDTYGVVDCFGFFNINKSEFEKIVAKFYKSEGKYIVTPEYVKTRLNQAIDISIKKKHTLPYEFVCWNVLMRDIEPMSDDLEKIISSSISVFKISKEDILELLTKDYTLRWFMKSDDSSSLKQVIDLIYSCENLDMQVVSEAHKFVMNSIFTDEVVSYWKDRLYNLIYLLYINKNEDDAIKFYSLINDAELFSIFKSVLVQRSIFNQFIALKEVQKDSSLTINIFKKRNTDEFKYDTKKLDDIINLIKKNWIYE